MDLSRSHSEFFFLNRPKVASSTDILEYTMCILSVYTLLKVVGYYDFSVHSMSVMGFQRKKFGWGVGGWVR